MGTNCINWTALLWEPIVSIELHCYENQLNCTVVGINCINRTALLWESIVSMELHNYESQLYINL